MKRLFGAILASALIVAMSVTAFAANSSTAAATMSTGTVVDEKGVVQAFTSEGTAQGINNAYLGNMAASTDIGGVAVAAVPAAESKVVYDAAKSLIGPNCYLITAFKPVAAVNGVVTISNASFKEGTNVTVLVRLADGSILKIKPTKIVNGKLVLALPDGVAVSSMSAFYDAVAPW